MDWVLCVVLHRAQLSEKPKCKSRYFSTQFYPEMLHLHMLTYMHKFALSTTYGDIATMILKHSIP
jgi:hypothetical protein